MILGMLGKIRKAAKNHLEQEKIDSLKKVWRQIFGLLIRMVYGHNLNRLASLFGTDKWGRHSYTRYYQNHFESLRRKRLNILEIGVGGDDNPRCGGGSLRMWKAYFPNSHVYGIDIHDKAYHNEPRIETFQGSQSDEAFLRYVASQIGRIDIVIDDGSHISQHVITSFKILFPLLSDNGVYVIEDTQTSYWVKYGGDSCNLNNPITSMGFLKSLIDGLNCEEYEIENYMPSYFDQYIVAMHFYHNLVFIQKGFNNKNSKTQVKPI